VLMAAAMLAGLRHGPHAATDDAQLYVEVAEGGAGAIGWVELLRSNPAMRGRSFGRAECRAEEKGLQGIRERQRLTGNESVKAVERNSALGGHHREVGPTRMTATALRRTCAAQRSMLKSRAGWPREALLIHAWRTARDEGHAVSRSKTDRGRVSLDNPGRSHACPGSRTG